MYENKTYITHDTVEAGLDTGDLEQSCDDDVSFDLDEERVVTVNNPPWQTAFDTDQFYVADATVARPIEQTYFYDGDEKTFKKPAEELKKSAWSLDNKPFTLGHPDSGRVKGVDDVRGFWRSPSYDEDSHDLNAELYVPINDDDALRYISENQDVSVGFSHRLSASEEDGIDAYQVDLYYDHVAGVERGRCPSDKGCGIGQSGRNVTVLEQSNDSQNMVQDDYDIAPYGGSYSADGTKGVHVENDYRDEDDRYYALSPEEGMGEPKYPIANCSDASDAWKLRGHGDYRVSQETLEERIKRRASELDCSDMPWMDDDGEESNDSNTGNTNMTDDCTCNDDGDGDTDVSFDASSFALDYIAERNDEVAQVVEERDEYETQVDELETQVDEKEEKIEELQDELDEYRQDEKDGIVEDITDITSTWDEDELRDLGLDELRDRLEVAKDIAEETGVANATKETTDDSPETGRVTGKVDPYGKHT